MIRMIISTNKGYLLIRSQSFTFLVVDSLPPVIFVTHISFSPLYCDVQPYSCGESSRVTDVSRADFHDPCHKKNPTNIMIQRDDGRIAQWFAQSNYAKITNMREIHVKTGYKSLERATGNRGIRFPLIELL